MKRMVIIASIITILIAGAFSGVVLASNGGSGVLMEAHHVAQMVEETQYPVPGAGANYGETRHVSLTLQAHRGIDHPQEWVIVKVGKENAMNVLVKLDTNKAIHVEFDAYKWQVIGNNHTMPNKESIELGCYWTVTYPSPPIP